MFKVYTVEKGKTKLFAEIEDENRAKELACGITIKSLKMYAFVIDENYSPLVFSNVPKKYKRQVDNVLLAFFQNK